MKRFDRVLLGLVIVPLCWTACSASEAFANETRVEYLTRDGQRRSVSSRDAVPSGAWIVRIEELQEQNGRKREVTVFEWERPETPCALLKLHGSGILVALKATAFEGPEPTDEEKCLMGEARRSGQALELACRAGRIRSEVDFSRQLLDSAMREARACAVPLSSWEAAAMQEAARAAESDPELAREVWLGLLELPPLPWERPVELPSYSAPAARAREH